MMFFEILAGIILLVSGRRLYWLFVGIVGFGLGVAVASYFMKSEPLWLILLIALAAGVAGALLARTLQTLVLVVAGFLAGGYALATLFKLLKFNLPAETWVLYLVGGIIGVSLVLFLFEWALMILSSVTGAALMVDAFKPVPQVTIVLFLILACAGVLFQSGLLTRKRALRFRR
jgi:hypothetical protein